MKYVKQFLTILVIAFLGEILHYLIPMPIPASIYGIVILFAGLVSGVIPLAAVKETGLFLVEIMPVMFIPAAVGLIDSWDMIRGSLVMYVIVMVCTTVGVMAVAGKVTQWMLSGKTDQRNNNRRNDMEEKTGA